MDELPLREVWMKQSFRRVVRRFFRDSAQGTHCLSVGALALGLGFGSLVPPAAVPPPSADPQPAPAALIAQAPPDIAPAVPVPPPPAPSPLHLLDTHDIPPGPFGALIYEVAARYSLNPHLVAAVVRVESSFNPRALSRKGACGLMQLLPETARRFGLRRKDLFDPAKNLDAGARYLKWLADRFGQDPARVLAAYNAGEGAVQRYGGVPPFKETRHYVDRIFSLLGLSDEPEPPAAVPAPVVEEAVLAR
jgi:soluble lytic murein transglycosylase-like protein